MKHGARLVIAAHEASKEQGIAINTFDRTSSSERCCRGPSQNACSFKKPFPSEACYGGLCGRKRFYGGKMKIGEPLRTIVVEPVEPPVNDPSGEPISDEPMPKPEAEPEPDQVPATH